MTRVFKVVPELAWADLRFEWILTACLVIAVAAVVAPLLILMGLKEGTISTLRHRLVEDSAYREIRPAETQEYNQQWFDDLRNNPHVGFLIPTILPASSIIQVMQPGTGKPVLLDLLPTAENDPVLLENDIHLSGPDHVVLSQSAAQELGVKQGEQIKARASRSSHGKSEYGYVNLLVEGILPASATQLTRLYAPLQLVLDVERYKEGMAVSARGWPGKVPQPYASYDGVLVLKKTDFSPLLKNALLIESGLANINTLKSSALQELTGLSLSDEWKAWKLTVPKGYITNTSYKAVEQKLRGTGAIALPYVKPFQLLINGRSYTSVGLSLSNYVAKKLGLTPSMWGGPKRAPKSSKLLFVSVPASSALASKKRVHAQFQGKRKILLPLSVVSKHKGEYIYLPIDLAAMLKTSRQRVVSEDANTGGLRMSQAGYRGFRLYAKSIDDVPGLVQQLENQGVAVIAEIEAIRRIQILDAGLTRLFWLIAVLGVVGGIAVLAASLYASVKRKGKDLAMLRLSGLSRIDLFAMPVYEGILIALGGVVVAALAYLSMATVINHVFTNELPYGEKICNLSSGYMFVALLITIGVAVLSSLTAAWKATKIDPADAIRAE